MKILLDECLPRRLKQEISNHEVVTVVEMGWAGTKNGALLRLAEPVFDVFITADRNLQYQQQISIKRLAVVVLIAPNNRLLTLRLLIPSLLIVLQSVRPGEVVNLTR